MKKTMLTLIAAMGLSLTAMAQQPTTPRGEQNGNNRPRPSKEQLVQKRTDQMVKEYGLSQKQAQKLFDLNKEFAEKWAKARPNGPRHNQHKGKIADGRTGATKQAPHHKQGPKANLGDSVKRGVRPHAKPKGPGKGPRRGTPNFGKEYREKLQKILTKKQYTKYLENELNRQRR
ncbi:MAG: DUF4890 domain-containing protein [Alloprevotella sp.]|nr:DUF4890 domain-containing protein [Alloprevotella sp.]